VTGDEGGDDQRAIWPNWLRALNISLLVIFPISWAAPLARAGLLPFFDLEAISILTALRELFAKDLFLAVIVTFFALFAPITKVIASAGIHFGYVHTRALPLMEILGKLAMADVFLIAVYIVVAKGVGVGRVETDWGLYLFTFAVLTSMLVTHLTKRALK